MVDEVLECPVDAFLNHYAPFKPSPGSITSVCDKLVEHSLVDEVEDGVLGLVDFATTSFEEPEPVIFERLKKIIDVLQSVVYFGEYGARRGRLFSYKDISSNNLALENDGTNFKVDVCITSDSGAKTIALSDVAAVVELKKSGDPSDIEDNRLKLISAAAQIMNDDPTRMWVYGITIEHTQMSVWYFCRSHSVKSIDFNFTTNIHTFISVFLSLLYAKRSEIGYDPTVTRVNHEGKICYVYEVGTAKAPRYYRTIELIFAARVSCITGRKTRVWKAVEVVGPKPGQFKRQKPNMAPVVLKDGWLDENSRPEKDTQSRIFERLDNIPQRDYKWAKKGYLRERLVEAFQDHQYKKYFMEIVDSRQLQKTKTRLLAAKLNPDTLSFAVYKPLGPLHSVNGTMQSRDRSGTRTNSPSRASGRKDNPQPRKYVTKQQHRLIYRDVGCSLSDAKELSTSLRAIHDTFIALVLLYLARWTHQDVSLGNIIIVEKDGSVQGKLNDLEYAREFSDEIFSADPKTGTPYFMPLEIHSSRPIYLSMHELSQEVEEDPFAPLSSNFKIPDSEPLEITERQEDEEIYPMKFRFQHDLESLWWVTLWVLLCRDGGDKAPILVKKIFTSGDFPSAARTAFFTGERNSLSKYIHEKLKPTVPTILEIRNILKNSYLSKTKTENMMDPAEYTEIYKDVWARLTKLILTIRHIEGLKFPDSERL